MNIPCPWCGNTSLTTELDENQGTKWGYALCPCGIRGPEVRTHYNHAEDAPWRARALEEWNNRHPAIAPAGVDDAVQGLVEKWRAEVLRYDNNPIRRNTLQGCIDQIAALAAPQDGAVIEAIFESVAPHVIYLRSIDDNSFPDWDGEVVLLQRKPSTET